MATHDRKTKLEALRDSVAAKCAWWDALHVLEEACGVGEEGFDYKTNAGVIEMIDTLAAGQDTKINLAFITDEHVASMDAIIAKEW